MNDLLSVLNHLAAAWLAQNGPAWGGLRLEEVQLEEGGFRVRARMEGGGDQDQLVVRGLVEESSTGRYRLHLRLERLPGDLPPRLAAFRSLLESGRVTLQLDFEEEIHEA